jgi:hypothetical protein
MTVVAAGMGRSVLVTDLAVTHPHLLEARITPKNTCILRSYISLPFVFSIYNLPAPEANQNESS